jgi:hypothetical protein
MIDIKKRFIALFIPLIAMTMFALVVMIKSFNTNEIWRIAFSVTGFIIFLGLTSIFVYSMSKKIKSERK